MYRHRSPPSGYGPPPGPPRNVDPNYPPAGALGPYAGNYAHSRAGPEDGYYDDHQTEPDLTADLRRLSMGPGPGPGPRGRDPTTPPTVSYGRSRSLRRRSSPNNDHLSQYRESQSQYNDSRSQYDDTRSQYDDVRSQYHETRSQYNDTRSQYGAEPGIRYSQPRRAPTSTSVERDSRYQPKGYHYSGPKPSRGRPQNPDEQERGVIMPAHNPRSQPRMGMVRRSSSMGASVKRRGSNETLRGHFPNPVPETAMVPSKDFGRSRSVSQAVRRPAQQRPVVTGGNETSKTGSTAVRLDVGGRELDIAIKDSKSSKRRGPVIGNLTINHIGKETKTESIDQRSRHPDEASKLSSSSASSDGYSHFSKQDFPYRTSRARSASLGNALSARAPQQLRIAGPPSVVPPTPSNGGEFKHTRISRKIVTREALEELGFDFEETGDTFTVLKILRPEEIDDLMDFTARIRATRHDHRRALSRDAKSLYLEYPDEPSSETLSRQGPINRQQPKPTTSMGSGERDHFGPPGGSDMPGAWPVGGGLRENPEMPGTYLGYSRGGPTMPQLPTSRFPAREGPRYYR